MNTYRTRASRRAEQKRRASAPARMLLAALGTAGAIVLGVLAGGGTFAVWATSASAAAPATVQSGSASLTVTPLTLAATDLYPGKTVFAATTVRNTGSTPLALAVQSAAATAGPSAFTSALAVSTSTGSSAADCAAGRATATTTSTLGAAPVSLGATLAPGATVTVCLGVGLPGSAPAAAAGAASTPLTFTLSGTQVRS